MMNSKKCLHLITVILFWSCVSPPSNSASSEQKTALSSSTHPIGLIELISSNQPANRQLPAYALGSSALLRFDLLESDFRYLSLKVRHCNSDWTPSVLRDLEFLDVYNEFPIRDYSFSQTNYTEYTSYKIEVPVLKKSGNYLLEVYDEDSKMTLFTTRLSIYQNKTGLQTSVTRADQPMLRNSHHKIDYEIDLMGLNVINPIQDLQIYIVQNNNWSNALSPISPTEIDLGRGTITYTSFDNANSLPANNEFRFFDTRVLSNRGLRVADQYLVENQPHVFLEPDESKYGLSFSEPFQVDLDGFFLIGNQDLLETQLNTEYVNVNFNLKSSPVQGGVYVTGRFNQWVKNKSNQMRYDSTAQSYTLDLLLKQGYYNYRYETISEGLDPYHFEGSHFQTQNTYEAFVYYREPGTVYDQLVGYQVFTN